MRLTPYLEGVYRGQAGSMPSTAGMEVRPEIGKIGLTKMPLAYSIGKSYGFTGFRGTEEVFRAKIRSQHAARRHSAEVGALFQLNLEEFPAIWKDYGKR